jgi:Lhr-like helicase
MISNTKESELASVPESTSCGPESAISARTRVADWLKKQTGLSESGAQQLADYFVAIYKALGVIPSRKKLVMERFAEAVLPWFQFRIAGRSNR